jgi:trehalose synthase
MHEVHVGARSIEPFAELFAQGQIDALVARARAIRSELGPRALWNINSTASGGGVAEMLRPLVRYTRGLGVDVRWLVIEGPPEFFRVTKRVHNALHGSVGDGSPLGPEQSKLFERVSHDNAILIDALVCPGDIVIGHDPQTAGLVPHLVNRGARVVWRCHIGHDRHGGEVERGWDFLRPYLEDVPLAVFSRAAYAPPWLHGKRTFVLPPNIDPFSPKNRALDEPTQRAILVHVGLVEGPPGAGARSFVRDDGSTGRVDRGADVVRLGRPPAWETPLVVQVSRWDMMKDPRGVLEGFARFLGPEVPKGAQLVLAGPTLNAVADDPEATGVFAHVQQAWLALPDALRRSIHLALLPMDDGEENAAIVNALQRHASVVVQKSLQEGFGLTVTEAMWKRRPVVASAVGGIQDQIRDGVDGLLVHDPTDLAEFAHTLRLPLVDDALAHRLGQSGHEHVREEYLSLSALDRWANLLEQLTSAS